MLRFLAIFFIALALTGCISEEASIPEEIIDREKMVNILEEVQVIEAVRQRGIILPDNIDSEEEAMKMYLRLFETYDINDSIYKASFEWYEQHPRILAEMYDEVLIRLSEKQALARQTIKPDSAKTETDKP